MTPKGALAMLGILSSMADYGMPRQKDRKDYLEYCTCKHCGKSFHPVSHNKRMCCSVECFKNHIQGGQNGK